jgi:hypothetical protein
MAPNNINQSNGKDLWTFSSFATLSGCVFAAYVFKSILVRFLRTPPELTGFIVSIVVAFAGLHFASKINLKSTILALFNGCLVFFTLVGGTSYFALATDKTADEEFRKTNPLVAAFITPLNQDKNLVKKNVTMKGKVRSLNSENVTLKGKVQSLDSENFTMKATVRSLNSENVTMMARVRSLNSDNEYLKRKNSIYKEDFNSIENVVKAMSPTENFRTSMILNKFSSTKNRLLQLQKKKK